MVMFLKTIWIVYLELFVISMQICVYHIDAREPCSVLKLEGRDLSFPTDKGLYLLQENRTENRPTYIKSKEPITYLFYNINQEGEPYWVVSDSAERVITGTKVKDTSLFPEDITSNWVELKGESGFVSNPTIHLTCVEKGCESGRVLVSGNGGSNFRINGLYSRTEEDFLGKPRYKHTSQNEIYIYYNNYTIDSPIWVINSSPDNSSADSLCFEDVDDPTLAVNQWQIFQIGAGFVHQPGMDVVCVPNAFVDCTLQNREVYVTVDAAKLPTLGYPLHNYVEGRYILLLNQISNFRPVFKHSDRQLFLYSVDMEEDNGFKETYWIISPIVALLDGWLKVKDRAIRPEFILERRWTYAVFAYLTDFTFQPTSAVTISCVGKDVYNKTSCHRAPCQNGGTCATAQNISLCVCPTNSWGQFCEHDRLECAEPTSMNNAVVTFYSGVQPYDIAVYKCQSGYLSIGDDSATCKFDGTWNSRVECVIQPIIGELLEVYVDETLGTNIEECGSKDRPCRDLYYGFLRAATVGTIFIVGKVTRCDIRLLVVDSVLTITNAPGTKTHSVVLCSDADPFLKIVDSHVVIMDVDISGGVVHSSGNVTLHMNNVRLSNMGIFHFDGELNFNMINSEWVDTIDCNTTSSTLFLQRSMGQPACDSHSRLSVIYSKTYRLNVTLQSNIFHGVILYLGAAVSTHIDIYNTTFEGSLSKDREVIRSFVSVITTLGECFLYIRNCVFANIVFVDNIQSQSYSQAALKLEDSQERLGNVGLVNATIEDCWFNGNTRAFLIEQGNASTIRISNCTFEDNFSFGEGGAITVRHSKITQLSNAVSIFVEGLGLGNAGTNVDIEIWNSTFESNFAMSYKTGGLLYTGRGGAISVDSKCKVGLYNTDFNNNSAELLGGAVYTGKDVALYMYLGTYINSASDLHPFMGDILYLTGQTFISGIHLIGETVNQHVPLLAIIGSSTLLNQFGYILEINVTCPTSHHILIRNSSLPNVAYFFEHLYYSCSPCEEGTYSLIHDSMWLRSYYEAPSFEHTPDNLFPDVESNVTEEVVHNPGICYTCPYGGYCQGNIKARQNFWGYRRRDEVEFEECEPGYGCSEEVCESYNTCSENRTGVLCTSCIPNHSEVLWGTNCVDDLQCENMWIFAVFAVYGLLYLIIILTEHETKSYISKQVRWVKAHTIQRCHKNNQPRQETKEEKGYVQIFVYYVQIAALLNVRLLYNKESAVRNTLTMFKFKFQQIFDFNVAPLHHFQCVFPGWSRLHTLALSVSFPLYLFVLMIIVYGLWKIFTFTKRHCGVNCCASSHCAKIGQHTSDLLLDVRFALAFLNLILFTYQSVTDAVFDAINCQRVDGDSVLLIYTQVRCYEIWQYISLLILAIYVIPLFIVLLRGPSLMKDHNLPAQIFSLSCLFPVAFVVVLPFYIVKSKRKTQFQHDNTEMQKAVIDKLDGSFQPFILGNWAGVIILRRLLLAVCSTFVHNVLQKHFLLCLLCMVIFLVQVIVKPLKNESSNILESVSLLCLTILSVISMVKSVYYNAGIIPYGALQSSLQFLEYTEFILATLIPLTIVCLVLILVFLRVFAMLISCCRGKSKKMGHTGNNRHSGLSLHSINTSKQSIPCIQNGSFDDENGESEDSESISLSEANDRASQECESNHLPEANNRAGQDFESNHLSEANDRASQDCEANHLLQANDRASQDCEANNILEGTRKSKSESP